jgi:iron complex outermembrane receptor protein
VQAGDFGIATDSPVGIYVDGVYTGKTGGALMNFIDVQRIEVVKGPQGTLFGRNSAAGAIAITTNEPGKEVDATATSSWAASAAPMPM